MNEPSVLDYLKSKLAFWKKSTIEIPEPEAAPSEPGRSQERVVSAQAGALPQEMGESGEAQIYAAPAVFTADRPVERVSGRTFGLSLAALALALLAQGFLEPPNRAVYPAAVLYALAALVWIYAYARDLVRPPEPVMPEVTIPPAPVEPDEAELDLVDDNATSRPAATGLLPVNYGLHLEGLAVGLVLMLLAFWAFGTPEGKDVPYFNFLNTAAWLLSVGYLVWAFFLPSSGGLAGLRMRIGGFLARPYWRIHLTRWALLLLVVIGVVLFFRFYRLSGVPADMVSDQAEKLLDVADVLDGQYRVFFPRNTGREAFQFYWTALMVKLFDTGVSFMALKLGTALIGLLTLYYMYRLGWEIGNRWVALLVLLFAGFSYWANVQARIGLRFPLYPGFFAPMLFYLVRGLRRQNRNDFIWSGIWLGIGLHGYTSYRIVPFVVVLGFLLYLLHQKSKENRQSAVLGFLILVLISLAVFMPLFRFAIDRPDMVALRSLTRLGEAERPLPGSPVEIFLSNTWSALVMFFWDDGAVWVHSIQGRPALDVISAALFFLGLALVVARYIRKRTWVDLFLLLSIPLLLMPSILSLAFPNENPNLNRTAGAYVPAFLILAIGAEALLSAVRRSLPSRVGLVAAGALGVALVVLSASNNFDLLFNQYDRLFRSGAWNTSEMGGVVRNFVALGGSPENAWTVAYPYWVDTRLVGINAGLPRRDTAINPDQILATLADPRSKLFLVNLQDKDGISQLSQVYPEGRFSLFKSRTPNKDFLIFYTPSAVNNLPDLPAGPD